jgi:ABC-type transport system involved in multi-copper enzyme maturation permease subunit
VGPLLKRFAAIAGLTLLEALRQPVLLLLTTTCALFILMLPVLLMHTMGESEKLVQDSALASHFIGGLLLGGYAASAALGRELRRGTLATVLSKPVERELFFLAKFAGVVGVLALFSLATGMATLLAAQMAQNAYSVEWRHIGPPLAAIFLAYTLAGLLNYFRQRTFVSTAFGLLVVLLGIAFALGARAENFPWQVLPASLLVAVATLVLAAVALAVITRLELVPTLAVCTVVLLAGLMSDYLFGRIADTNPVAAVVYHLLPNWQHFWVADGLMSDGKIPWVYVRQATEYGLFYLLGVLSLGILSFRNVEPKI